MQEAPRRSRNIEEQWELSGRAPSGETRAPQELTVHKLRRVDRRSSVGTEGRRNEGHRFAQHTHRRR